MQKSASLMLASLLFVGAGSAAAATPDDVCAALADARGHLVNMIASTDKATNDGLKGKIQAASTQLETALADVQKSDSAKAAAFKPAWEAFKNTRETEIIPAIYANKNADAKALATGIQAERMTQMKTAMGCK